MFSTAELQALASQVSWLGPVAGFVAGLASALTPAYLPFASTAAGVLAGGRRLTVRRAGGLAAALVAGMMAATGVVGALLGLWGAIVIRLLTQRLFIWNLLAGVILGFVGLATLGLVRIPVPGLRRPVGPIESPAGAFALGLPFGLTTCPSCVALLLPLATGAAASGTPWYGATLFAAFSLGLGVPILILAVSAPALGRFQRLGRLAKWLQLAGGLLLLLASAYFFLEAYKIWSVT